MKRRESIRCVPSASRPNSSIRAASTSRYLLGPMARAMVAAGRADVANANGKVRSVRLIAMASNYARMIGLPTDGCAAPPFAVRERLDGGFVVWKHHPRCCDYE